MAKRKAKTIKDILREKAQNRQLPVEVIRTLTPLIFIELKDIKIKDDIEILGLENLNKNSEFYFDINDNTYDTERGLEFHVEFCPENCFSNSTFHGRIKAEIIIELIKEWLENIKSFDEIAEELEDPILYFYEREFYTEISITDIDSPEYPFDTKRVLLIDQFLENLSIKIEEHKTTENESIIIDIQNKINETRNNLTLKTKKWIIKNLAKIWGKITKQGPKMIRELLSEANKALIREGIKNLLE